MEVAQDKMDTLHWVGVLARPPWSVPNFHGAPKFLYFPTIQSIKDSAGALHVLNFDLLQGCDPSRQRKPQKQAGPSNLCPVGHTWLRTVMDVVQQQQKTLQTY